MKNIPSSVLEFINFSAGLLTEKGIEDARLNAELLLCKILNFDRVNLYLNFDKPLNQKEIETFKKDLIRRINHEPLQYILGTTSFFGIDIIVNKDVLIPRPETEILTEKVLEDIRKSNKSLVSIFEVGTGSGCIPIALAKNLEKDNRSYKIFSIDISESAVNLAKENLKLNHLDNSGIRFIKKDVFEIDRLKESFDYIVSNPPYVSFDEYNLLEPEVKDNEPGIALTDYENGMKYFERLFLITSDKDFTGKLFCEIGFGQKEKIEGLLVEHSLNNYFFFKDYNGTDRILKVVK